MSKNKGIGIWYYDSEDEFEEEIHELENNPDFTFIGSYDDLQDMYDEFEYQGFSNDEVDRLTHTRYGVCIDILECANNQYYVYYGAR